jgi:hypothetical protein
MSINAAVITPLKYQYICKTCFVLTIYYHIYDEISMGKNDIYAIHFVTTNTFDLHYNKKFVIVKILYQYANIYGLENEERICIIN